MATAGSSLSATPSSRRPGAGRERRRADEVLKNESNGGETEAAREGLGRKKETYCEGRKTEINQ